jgi:hypothetical protein
MDEQLQKLNELAGLAIADVTAEKEPDLEALAAQVGIDLESNRHVIEKIITDLKDKVSR